MILKKISVFKPIILSFALALLLVACNEKPTDLGYSLLEDTLSAKTLISSKNPEVFQGFENYHFNQLRLNVGTVFIGKYKDFRAMTFLRFGDDMPDSLAYLTSDKILSCKISIMPKRYGLGDTASNRLGFNIYKTVKLWQSAVTWDSVFNSDGSSSYIDLSNPLGHYSGAIPFQDTMSRIETTIDKSIVLEWLKARPDTEAKKHLYGIALVPTDECSYIRQFESSQVGVTEWNSPELIFSYINYSGQTVTDTIKTVMELSPVTKLNGPAKGDFVIEGATEFSSKFNIDISKMEAFSCILQTELDLTVDQSGSYVSNLGYPDNIAGMALARNALYTPQAGDTVKLFSASKVINGSDIVYHFSSINAAVEYWNKAGGIGYFQVIPYMLEHEFQKMDYIKFYGPDAADVNKRPKLKIIYSTRPFNQTK